jgi:hypothetical protein
VVSWANHIKGLAALLKLRGPEQMTTKIELRMFLQQRHQIILSCIQRGVRVPQPIIDWNKLVRKNEDPAEVPRNEITDILVIFAMLRASFKESKITDPSEIILLLIAIDNKLKAWIKSIPQESAYYKMPCLNTTDHAFEDYHLVYPNLASFSIWNPYRCVRLVVNESLLDELKKPTTSSLLTLSTEERQNRITACEEVLNQISRDVRASVPYCLGLHNVSCNIPLSAHQPVGAYFLMWPIFIACVLNSASIEMRSWGIKMLETIRETTGIDQATFLAQKLRLYGGGEIFGGP